MGATEYTTEVRVPASVLIYPSPIIYGQLGGWKLEESSIRITSSRPNYIPNTLGNACSLARKVYGRNAVVKGFGGSNFGIPIRFAEPLLNQKFVAIGMT